MTTETLPEQELGTEPEALTTPEPVVEPTPETPVEPEVFEEVESYLKEQGLVEDGGSDAGKGIEAKGEVADPLTVLTPEARTAAEAVIAQREAAAKDAETARQRESYVASVRENTGLERQRMIARMNEVGLDLETQTFIINRYDAVNGWWKTLNDADVQATHGRSGKAFTDALHRIVSEQLPKAKINDADYVGKPDGLKGYTKAVIEAAREGFMSPAEVNKAKAEAIRKAVADLSKKPGVVIPGFRSPETGVSTGAVTGRRDYAWFNGLSIEDQEKVPAEERRRIYAEDMSRRARNVSA